MNFTGNIAYASSGCQSFTVRDPSDGQVGVLGGSIAGPTSIVLHLGSSVLAGQNVLLSYQTGTVTDGAGNPITIFTDQPVTNLAGAPTASFANASVLGPNLTVNFTGNIACASSGCQSFTVRDPSDGQVGVLGGSIAGPTSIVLHLGSSVLAGQNVLLSYQTGTVTDGAGNPITIFTDQPVTNLAGAPTATPLPGGGGGGGGGGGTPPPSETPELGSLALFGSGLAGAGGYVLLRLRTRRRR